MIHETKIWVVDDSLQRLGIDTSDQELWHDVSIVFGNVGAYKPYYEDGDPKGEFPTNKTTVYIGGLALIIKTHYDLFHSLMQQYLREQLR